MGSDFQWLEWCGLEADRTVLPVFDVVLDIRRVREERTISKERGEAGRCFLVYTAWVRSLR